MSNRKEAIFAMLGAVSIGAIWVGALPLMGSQVRSARCTAFILIDHFNRKNFITCTTTADTHPFEQYNIYMRNYNKTVKQQYSTVFIVAYATMKTCFLNVKEAVLLLKHRNFFLLVLLYRFKTVQRVTPQFRLSFP